ncbi:MAG: hypothetical protein WDM92_10155 [Caulobacteraceae bacterium]
MSPIQALIDKIAALPRDRLAEVEDFVDFLRLREHDQTLTRAGAATSAPPSPPSGTTPKTTSTMRFEFGDVG